MTEKIRDDEQATQIRKWSLAGVGVFASSIILGIFLLVQEIFLIPPLFSWSIPIYLSAWLIILILWVGFTPARKVLLWLILPGVFFTVLGLVLFISKLDNVAYLFFLGNYGYENCVSVPSTVERRVVCNGGGTSFTDLYYFYSGPVYSPFISPSENGTLTGVDLRGENLAGKNLSSFNLSGANLSGANLSGADLSWVDLSKADLKGADLSGADLTETVFRFSDLTGANFEAAVLVRTNFNRATLDPEAIEKAAWIRNVLMPDNKVYTR
jgi:hypothetical protein